MHFLVLSVVVSVDGYYICKCLDRHKSDKQQKDPRSGIFWGFCVSDWKHIISFVVVFLDLSIIPLDYFMDKSIKQCDYHIHKYNCHTLHRKQRRRKRTSCHSIKIQSPVQNNENTAYVGLSIILDTIIKKFDRRKPFEGTHRTVVCST